MAIQVLQGSAMESRQVGRPRLAIAPKCPLHPGSKVYLDDRRGTWSPYHEKRGFRCYPANGAKHRLSLPERMRHPTTAHPHTGGACPTCDTEYAANAGPRLGEDFTFTSQEVAKALYPVGTGESLRRAAHQARRAATRFMFDPAENTWAKDPITGRKTLVKTDPKRVRAVSPNRFSTQCNLSASYLDAFGRAVADAIRPRQWPRFLMIDSQPLRTRRFAPGEVARGDEAGEILAAVDRTSRPGTVFTLHLAGGKSHTEWLRFFDRADLTGEPEWIVADKDPGIELAVKTKWPNAVLYNCEGHLWRNAIGYVEEDGIPEWIRKPGAPAHAVAVTAPAVRFSANQDVPWPLPTKEKFFERHPLHEALGHMFDSVEAWDKMKAVVEETVPKNRVQLRRWITRVEAEVLQQFIWRQQFPSAPRGVGPVEAVLQTVSTKFRGRAGRFANARRLQVVLDLMALHFAGLSSEVQYTTLIRDHFRAHGGGSGQNRATWPTFWDPAGTSSLDALVSRKDAETSAAYIAKQDASGAANLRAKVEAEEAARAAAGLPSLRGRVLRAAPKQRPSMRGKVISDFPEVLAEWDWEKNDPADPTKIPALSKFVAHWRCTAHLGEPVPHLHEWTSQASSRITNQSGCRFCLNRAPCPSNSLAALRPDLAREWHPTRNGALTPDDVLPGAATFAWWKCLAKPRHPAFRQRLSARTRQLQGCPKCGVELRSERRRQRFTRQEREKRDIARTLRHKLSDPSKMQATPGHPVLGPWYEDGWLDEHGYPSFAPKDQVLTPEELDSDEGF